jgi:hypothetical protein
VAGHRDASGKSYEKHSEVPSDLRDSLIAEATDLYVKKVLSALTPAPEKQPVAPFEFDRYINGRLMAEGVRIERKPDLASASVEAARIASRGPNGEVPVLILRAAPPSAEKQPASEVERLAAARKKHVDAVNEYNARVKLAKAEFARGNYSMRVHDEYRAMSDAQSEFIRVAQEVADAALTGKEN